MTGFASESALAIRLAVEASKLIREAAETGFECIRKGSDDLVTSADLAVDALLSAGIAAQFPEDGLLTEESGWTAGSSDRVWIIDPLDGTRAFARGEPGTCVHLALHCDGALQLGVVADPMGGRVAWALRGEGAWESDEDGRAIMPLRVSRGRISSPRLVTSLSMSAARRDALVSACGWIAGPRVRGAGYKMLTICRGEGDVYFSEHPLHVWDTAAPLMIAWEAGASASELSGAEITFPLTSGWRHDGGLVVTAGLEHAPTVARLEEAWSAVQAGR